MGVVVSAEQLGHTGKAPGLACPAAQDAGGEPTRTWQFLPPPAVFVA